MTGTNDDTGGFILEDCLQEVEWFCGEWEQCNSHPITLSDLKEAFNGVCTNKQLKLAYKQICA